MSVYGRVHSHAPPATGLAQADDDDWETDPTPANPISEKEQRWGSAVLPDDKKNFSDIHSLREAVIQQDSEVLGQEAFQVTGARKQEYQQPVSY